MEQSGYFSFNIKKLIDAVEDEIQLKLRLLPRKAIAEKAIANSKLICRK
jgi:histidinol dehydrogenase